jgi:hypothetical protein
MKRSIANFVLFAISATLLLALGTAGRMKQGKVKKLEEVAVISVFCDKRIDMSDFKSLSSAANELAQNEGFNLKPIAEKLRDDIFSRYSPGFPFAVKEEDSVIQSSAYEKLAARKFDANRLFFASPDGYVVIRYTEKKEFKALLDDYPDSEAFLFCAADFRLEKTSSLMGFGTAKVKSNVEITAVDRKQNLIMKKTSNASSDDTIKFSLGGVFDASQVEPLCIQATEKAAEKFEEWFADKTD